VFGKFTISPWDNGGAVLPHVLPWLWAEYLADGTNWEYPRRTDKKAKDFLRVGYFGGKDEFGTIRPQEAEKFLPNAH
jgi:hypothetical protein